MFAMFPLLMLSILFYTGARYILGVDWVNNEFATVVMVSGDPWLITGGHAFLIGSMFLLFWELLRSTRTGTDSLVNHALSALVFIVGLLMFIIIPGFGNSIFFIVVSMTFLDFMAGFIVTTVTARRDFGVAA